jgi:3-deoxy-manno-octulosonate cytidylyltransferase (CMP-KDO synthetase)
VVATGKTLIVIPARRASTRLPEKLLLRESGRPLLRHTIERGLEAAERLGNGAGVWVVADDAELVRVAREGGVGAVLTGPADSGTERIARALGQLPHAEVILNLQADEPDMPAEWIVDCVAALTADSRADVATVAVPVGPHEPALADANAVKVVLDHRGGALYFSRAPIPALRQGGRPPEPRALRHVGLYAYRTSFLRDYPALPPSPLEACECLEQLRFLQAGKRIAVIVKSEPVGGIRGIDTREDYEQFVARSRTGQRAV